MTETVQELTDLAAGSAAGHPSASAPHDVSLAQLAPPHPLCRAIVIVPARNEEFSLHRTLDALCRQVTCDSDIFPGEQYEVLLLLNNCTDNSVAVAERYARLHPGFALHIASCQLDSDRAHVGTARSMLMNSACDRLEILSANRPDGSPVEVFAMLSTDADTCVAPDWVARNLAELKRGADAVGGVIHLFAEELAALDPGIRKAYLRDRLFQVRVAQLESLLDPDPADPWPRHLEHFGASLACTPEIYRRCGGMPAIRPLEDVAFVDALRRAQARIRHSPQVHIFTSARLEGRAEVGLSGQLRHWQREVAAHEPHMVDSAVWLEHRFRSLAALRLLAHVSNPDLTPYPASWHPRLQTLVAECLPVPTFLERLDCSALIEAMFLAPGLEQPGGSASISSARLRREPIDDALAKLNARLLAYGVTPAATASPVLS